AFPGLEFFIKTEAARHALRKLPKCLMLRMYASGVDTPGRLFDEVLRVNWIEHATIRSAPGYIQTQASPFGQFDPWRVGESVPDQVKTIAECL
ncbi:MAG: hypothetical protein N2F24_01450, partial [Deltaproteobacteria bacterium]